MSQIEIRKFLIPINFNKPEIESKRNYLFQENSTEPFTIVEYFHRAHIDELDEEYAEANSKLLKEYHEEEFHLIEEEIEHEIHIRHIVAHYREDREHEELEEREEELEEAEEEAEEEKEERERELEEAEEEGEVEEELEEAEEAEEEGVEIEEEELEEAEEEKEIEEEELEIELEIEEDEYHLTHTHHHHNHHHHHNDHHRHDDHHHHHHHHHEEEDNQTTDEYIEYKEKRIKPQEEDVYENEQHKDTILFIEERGFEQLERKVDIQGNGKNNDNLIDAKLYDKNLSNPLKGDHKNNDYYRYNKLFKKIHSEIALWDKNHSKNDIKRQINDVSRKNEITSHQYGSENGEHFSSL